MLEPAVLPAIEDSTVLNPVEVLVPQADTVVVADTVAEAPAEPVLTKEELLAKAVSCFASYDFPGAQGFYEKALSMETDSTAIAEIIAAKVLADNGARMMEYVQEPSVVARHRFSRRDFHLFYPLDNGGWTASPNSLDPEADKVPSATFVADSARTIVWSRNDGDRRNLYMIENHDTAWSQPAPVGDDFLSDGNEIWPMLSADGNTLYFSSDGLYGLGGYDLFMSQRDAETGEWGVPMNMGFPFSSPADDFLFVNTPDEKYTVFASNRACSADSVDVYILEFEAVPVRKAITEPARLAEIMLMDPVEATSFDNGSATSTEETENVDTKRYMDKMEEVRSLRDSLARATRELNELRVDFATSDDPDYRATLTTEILAREQALPEIKKASDKAVAELQEIELDFLFKGVVIDPDKLQKKAEQEVVGSTNAAYTFTKREPVKLPDMVFEEPVEVEED